MAATTTTSTTNTTMMPNMKIVDTGEVWQWDEERDEGTFSHTVVVATDPDSRVYLTKTQDRQPHVVPESLEQWSEIPTDHIYPIRSPNLSVFQTEINEPIYHKVPRFVGYDGSCYLAESLLHEATVYEKLQKFESPFIARYHGCLVSNDRITGLALSKYDQTLDARMKQDFGPAEAAAWLNQIRCGLEIIHDNGFAHNDLSPENIMVHDEVAVIIDLDSCRPLGEPLLKCGTPGWSDEEATLSAIANDTYSLRILEGVLCTTPSH